jgi:hypothetical protein
MVNLENKKILKINYSDKASISKYKTEKYRSLFDWKEYLKNYRDLKINNFNDAWIHWCKFGLKERRKFFVKNSAQNEPTIEVQASATQKLSYSSKLKNEKSESNKSKLNKKHYKASIVQTNPHQNKISIKPNSHNKDIKPATNNIKSILSTNVKKNDKLIINYDDSPQFEQLCELVRNNNLICKKRYDNYGLHYFGWKNVINNFLQEYSSTPNWYTEQFFFDEWIEKLLIWGDRMENLQYIKEIKKNYLKIISFIHNPPYTKWYDSNYCSNIKNDIIYNSEHTNKNLYSKIEKFNLIDNIQYIYTLSNDHKEYLYYKCPLLQKKLVSIFHPILITGEEKKFDMLLFNQNKQIIHIGWWLRNFKAFIDFKQPKEYSKTILVKKGFEGEWNIFSGRHKMDHITILKELNNLDYEKLFINSCLFLHLEDTTANNVILEAIKFNTPIIVNRLPAIEEYLGASYPLFYNNNDDLKKMQNSNYFVSLVEHAHDYLKTMDKSHLSCETFNAKLVYDMGKIQSIKDFDQNKFLFKITWFCCFDTLDNYVEKIAHLYKNFANQNNNTQNLLYIVIPSNTTDHALYEEFVEYLNKYTSLFENIEYNFVEISLFNDYLNYAFEKCSTPYLTFINLDDVHDTNYSKELITYLDNTPSVDIAYTSYNLLEKGYCESIKFEKNMIMLKSNFSKIIISCFGIVWRKNLFSLIGEFKYFNNQNIIFRDYLQRCLQNHMNVWCCSEKPLFTIN